MRINPKDIGEKKPDFLHITIAVGETRSITPRNSAAQIELSSSDESVAKADGGTITGVSECRAEITAKIGSQRRKI